MNPSHTAKHSSPSKGTPAAFWLVLLTFFMCLAVNSLVPSFQSPDEDAHLKRAYLLAHGQIWLDHPQGQASGGLVDQGLLNYMDKFSALPFHGERKVFANDIYEAKQIEWARSSVFAATSGISYYFPILYAPQALGIRIGEMLGLSVHTSYQIAKISALLAACLLLYWALSLYTFSALSISLFILPMSLFQMGATSIDGVAHASCLVVIAMYLKLNQMQKQTPAWFAYILCALIILLTTTRMHLLPLLLLPFLAHRITKQPVYLWGAIAASLFTLSWILVSIIFVVDPKTAAGLSPTQLIAYYAMHPLQLLTVISNTLTSFATLKSYATAFIGVLGWLDASLPKVQYAVLGSLLGLLGLSCITWRPKTVPPSIQKVFVVCSLGSIAIIFLSLLIQWTPHPATIILGVQGRYFFAPILLLTVAFSKPLMAERSANQILSSVLLIILGACSVTFTSQLLLQRYYLVPERIETSSQTLEWSKLATANQALPLVFSAYQSTTPAKLQGISLLIDATSPGVAQLELLSASEPAKSVSFAYLAGKKSTYLPIAIPLGSYTSAKILASDGQEFNIQMINSNDGVQRACLVYELSDGSRRYTPACP